MGRGCLPVKNKYRSSVYFEQGEGRQEGRYLRRADVDYLNRLVAESVLKLKRITSEETKELIVLMRKAEKAGKYRSAIRIRNRIVEGNLRLVLKFARDYSRRYKKELSDLISVGGVGMMRALETYDSEKGEFGTYVPYWIKSTMSKYTIVDNMITRSVNQYFRYNEINKARKKVGFVDSRELMEEVAKLTGYSIENVERVLETYRKCNGVVSLIEGYHDKDNIDVKMPSGRLIMGERRKLLLEAMQKNLSFLERQVVTYRYGLDEKYEPMRLEELGGIFHLTRERIRQIQESGIKKLQKSKVLRVLKGLVA